MKKNVKKNFLCQPGLKNTHRSPKRRFPVSLFTYSAILLVIMMVISGCSPRKNSPQKDIPQENISQENISQENISQENIPQEETGQISREPVPGHIDSSKRALLVDEKGEKIVIDGEFVQCLKTGDGRHIIAQGTDGMLYVYDAQGKNPQKVDAAQTALDASDTLVTYYKKTGSSGEESAERRLGCYIYDTKKQIDLGVCSGDLFVKNSVVMFSNEGSVYYFDPSMDTPELVYKGNSADFVEIMGISQDGSMALWYCDSGQERDIFCRQDGDIQIVDSIPKGAVTGSQVMFFDNGTGAVIYGDQYNKIIIKEKGQEPRQITGDGTLYAWGITEPDGQWRLYYTDSKNDIKTLYITDTEQNIRPLAENVGGVIACLDNDIYYWDTDHTFYQGKYDASADQFTSRKIGENILNGLLSDSGNAMLVISQPEKEEGRGRLSYGRTSDLTLTPATDDFFMFALTPDDSGFYYTEWQDEADSSEDYILYYQDFDGGPATKIDDNVILIDHDRDCYIPPSGLVYFKQIVNEDTLDLRIEMYCYNNGEKHLISDSVSY